MSGTPETTITSTSVTSRAGVARRWLAVFGWVVTIAYFAAAGLILVTRYWILPDIDRYSGEIERAVSHAVGERVTIGEVGARWQGLHPQLELKNVRIHDRQDRVALLLPSVEAVIGWRSLIFFSLRLHSLSIDQPALDIRRDRAGKLFVAGIELRSKEGDAGAGDWLLTQTEIVIRNASLTWVDELRSAPALSLAGLTFMLRNSGSQHRFALRAQADPALASQLDVRGEFQGDSLADLAAWRGLVFAELDYVDLAAWKHWVDYPMEVISGKGAMRIWLASDGERITQANADLALSSVKARVAPDLPLLDLEYLRGRLGGERSPVRSERQRLQAHGSHLTLKSVNGVALPPADFSIDWDAAAPNRAERGELLANSLQFEPLANLAEFLPFPAGARAKLAAIAPRGTVNELKMSWTGPLDDLTSFNVRGRFSGLEMRAPGGWGSFRGLTGELNANQATGSLKLNSGNLVVDLPSILPDGTARADKFEAQVNWTLADKHADVKFSNVSIVNADGVAQLSGTYSSRSKYPNSAGVLDLTAQFPKVDPRLVYRYIPYLPADVARFLKTSIVAGQASDGRLRIKGDLHDFPFADPKIGVFQTSARFAGAEMNYVEGWPHVQSADGEFRIDGRRLTVTGQRGNLSGARLSNTRVQIPDVFGNDPRVQLEGNAEGASAEFLAFIERSPVSGMIGGATRGISATGNGRLNLKLDIPLRRVAQTRVEASYQLLANQIEIEGGIPPFGQVSGTLNITERGVNARDLSAQFLGGAATVAMASRPDGSVDFEGQGTSNIALVRKFFDIPMLDRVNGNTSWRGNLRVGKDLLNLTVESPLVGVTSTLPEPLNKSAGESLPFRLDISNRGDADFLRRLKAPALPAGGDAIHVNLGAKGSGLFLRRKSASGLEIARGSVGIGEPIPPLERPGISVSATVPHVDADQWRMVFGGADGGKGGEGGAANLNITAATLDFGGRRLNNVRLRAAPVSSAWGATISARELTGNVTWRPEGAGRLVARLKYFTVPDAAPGAPQAEAANSELPALDIVADSFVLGTRQLGRLELIAVNEGRDWRIEKMNLVNAESRMSATGVWQNWAVRPSISLTTELEVSDVGGYMARMGFPGTMRDGTAKLRGKIGWVGNPQTIDFPTLTGEIELTSEKGQFLKAEPGIAKLLGILSMQAWITFDFRGIFGDGFVYDTITSTAKISRGILTTEDFAMTGKTAKVSMSGTVNLAQETQNLKVRVVPALGDGLSSVAVLSAANPAVGVVALLLQRLLGDPVGKIFAFDYTVLGSWSDPKVEKLGAGEKPAQSNMKTER
jgi:uncharacterized protein (TIGR02099 family)